MSTIQFRTLGTLDLRAADGRELHSLLAQPKRIALLAYLCIAQPRGYHRRDTLLGLFWPDSDQEHARTSWSHVRSERQREGDDRAADFADGLARPQQHEVAVAPERSALGLGHLSTIT